MPRRVRDIILLAAGLLGIGYETVIVKVDRPELLVLFAGMVGLPVFFRGDDYRRDDDEGRTRRPAHIKHRRPPNGG